MSGARFTREEQMLRALRQEEGCNGKENSSPAYLDLSDEVIAEPRGSLSCDHQTDRVRPADMSSPALAKPVRYNRLRLAQIGSGPRFYQVSEQSNGMSCRTKQRISRPDLSNFPDRGKFLDRIPVIPELLMRPAHCTSELRDVAH